MFHFVQLGVFTNYRTSIIKVQTDNILHTNVLTINLSLPKLKNVGVRPRRYVTTDGHHGPNTLHITVGRNYSFLLGGLICLDRLAVRYAGLIVFFIQQSKSQDDVVLTFMRHNVASATVQHYFDVMCLLGGNYGHTTPKEQQGL